MHLRSLLLLVLVLAVPCGGQTQGQTPAPRPQPGDKTMDDLLNYNWPKEKKPALTHEQAQKAALKRLKDELSMKILFDRSNPMAQVIPTCASIFRPTLEVRSVAASFIPGSVDVVADVTVTNSLDQALGGKTFDQCFSSMSMDSPDGKPLAQLSLLPDETVKLAWRASLRPGFDF